MGMFDDLVPDNPESQKKTNPAYTAGRQATGWQQGLASGLQGPTFGFGDELLGAAGATVGTVAGLFKDDGKDIGQRYRDVRDYARGMQDFQREKNPGTTIATQLMTGAPTMGIGFGAPAVGVTLGLGKQIGRAAATGGITGAVQGAGESTADSLLGVAGDALGHAAIGTSSAGVLTGGASVMGAAANAVRQRLSKPTAARFAQLKVAEALARDNPAGGIDDAANALRSLGREGTIADAGGVNARALLDIVSLNPGETGNALNAMQRARQAGRGGRLVSAADDALNVGGQRLSSTLEALRDAQVSKSRPLYAQIENAPVVVEQNMADILKRAAPLAKEVEDLAVIRTGKPVGVKELAENGGITTIGAMDRLKQSLYDAAEAARLPNGRATDKTHALNELRTELIDAIDRASPKNAGGSIYAQARKVFGGFAEVEHAAKAGRKAMTDDTEKISEYMKGMGMSEIQAFRVGALEGLRAKAGTEGGQSQLLAYWKNPNTAERLKVIFGGSFPEFGKALETEKTLKILEGIGPGRQSATAGRAIAQHDLGTNPYSPPTSVRGLASRAVDSAAAFFARAPEPTRNEIGRILMAQGPEGERQLNALRVARDRANQTRAGRATVTGQVSGRMTGAGE